MAIPQHYANQYENKLAKGISRDLYNALCDTLLHHNFKFHWQHLTNKKRIIIQATWSNLQRAIDVLTVLPNVYKGSISRSTLQPIIQELQEVQEDAPLFPKDVVTTEWRTDFSPEEYQRQKMAFQFVLDQFEHNYDWRTIPHEFRYKEGTRPRVWYRRVRGTAYNGGHYYEIHSDPSGSFHSGCWYTYGRNSLGWKAKGIKVSEDYPKFLKEIYLIHEVTHAVENYYSQKTRQKYTNSEMNTTLHELRYTREHYPEIFRKLTPVQDGRKNKWWSPVEPLEGQNPQAEFQRLKSAAAPSGK